MTLLDPKLVTMKLFQGHSHNGQVGVGVKDTVTTAVSQKTQGRRVRVAVTVEITGLDTMYAVHPFGSHVYLHSDN